MTLKRKLRHVIDFVLLLRIEPYLLLFIFVMYLKKVPFDQIIQDKICLQWYNLTRDYCYRLPQMSPDEDVYNKKSAILGDVTQFNFYVSLITTVPGVIFSVFIGSWTDRYVDAKKVLLLLGAIASVVESLILTWNAIDFDLPVNYLLISFIPTGVIGGNITCYTSLWSYVASTTPPKLRAIRMTIMELIIYTAYLISTYSAGKMLYLDQLFSDKQLYNYSAIFVVNTVANALAIAWALFVINEGCDKRKFCEKFPSEQIPSSTTNLTVSNITVYTTADNGSADIETGGNSSITIDKQSVLLSRESFVSVLSGKNAPIEQKVCDDNNVTDDSSSSSKAPLNTEPIRLLFDLSNIKEMLVTCLKRRTNHARLQLWLIFLSTVCYLMAYISPLLFLYQFTQRVYAWNAETFSTWNSLAAVGNALATLVLLPILVKIHTRDTIIALIGLVTYLAQNLLRAIILSPVGFYVSIVFGALGSITAVGIKAHASKIVEHSELGKVFSLMSALEATTPLVASSIFTFMFKATVDSSPGVNFYITAGFVLVPIFIFIWIDRCTELPVFVDRSDASADQTGM